MGECGCRLAIGRCKIHKDDVILVLDADQARVLKSGLQWVTGDRAGASAGVQYAVLKSIIRDLDQGGAPHGS